MRIGVQGAGGVLGGAVVQRLRASGEEVVRPTSSEVEVVIHATPPEAWQSGGSAPGIAAAVGQAAARTATVDVPAAGWWGGLGTLLAGVVTDEAADAREVHVAYGFPGSRDAFTQASSTLRQEVVAAAMDHAEARIRGEVVPEALGEGRRLAWFPPPVGPAHAVAVGGLEHLAPLPVPTVRTWLAAGSMTAELLQAVGRLDRDRGVGAVLDRRAAARGGGPGATSAVRWAVVVEALDADGTVVRAWANGTDPIATAADLLVVGARRLAGLTMPPPSGSVLELGPPAALLDELADLRSLRWSVSRPEPSHR